MKDLLASAGVPTARHRMFRGSDDLEAAFGFLDTLAPPYVVKTDGLAAGKGVAVVETTGEAREHVHAYLSGAAFGDAGRTLVIEEGLTGPELSLLVLCDGTEAVALEPAQDFKRIHDDDDGPNTGGMGAYSPVPIATPEIVDEVMAKAVRPTLDALRARDIEYRGILYAGLMLTAEGPKIIEYNVRFGDPECQVVVPAARQRPVPPLLRVGPRPARDAVALRRQRRGDGRARGRRLPGRHPHRRRDPRARRGRGPRRRRPCSTPARGSTATRSTEPTGGRRSRAVPSNTTAC